MSDGGVAVIAGAFALACAGAGAGLTFLGTNWLRTKEQGHEDELQRRLIEAEARARDTEELRRLRREKLQPVFDILEEIDRYVANRLWVGAYEKQTFDSLPQASKDILGDAAHWDAVRERLVQDAAKGLEIGEAWRSMPIRAAWAALRIDDDEPLQNLLVVLSSQVGLTDLDIPRVGGGLIRFRRDFLAYAARVCGTQVENTDG